MNRLSSVLLILLSSFWNCWVTEGSNYDRNEPRCSKYDLEERILEKSIRTEIMMAQYMEKLEAALGKMAAYINAFEESKKTLKEYNIDIRTETKEALENMTSYMKKALQESNVAMRSETTYALGNMTDFMNVFENTKKTLEESNAAITELRSRAIVPAVSFNVRKAKDLTPAVHQVMTFEHVIQNMGGAYNGDTGIFTAPYDGIYLFGVQVCAQYMKHGVFNLVVDDKENEILVVVDYDQDNMYTSSSGTAVHYLTKGQRVWVVNISQTELIERENWCWNQFTGVLIHL